MRALLHALNLGPVLQPEVVTRYLGIVPYIVPNKVQQQLGIFRWNGVGGTPIGNPVVI